MHIAKNKDKILLVLCTSKTHDKSSRPQKIKITANSTEKTGNYVNRYFCPFALMRQYICLCGSYHHTGQEQFFVFSDKTAVLPNHARKLLKRIFQNLRLQGDIFGMHSFRIGIWI